MTRNACCFAAIACLLVAGCAPSQSTKARVATPASTASEQSDSLLAATDPCAVRMQDICGALLEYYVVNHHLPTVLQELQGFGDTGSELNFTCPISGKPYVYVPDGLAIPNVDRRLVLYDATPAHNGKSWGIVVTPALGNNPMMGWVIPLNAELLKAYVHGAAP